MAMMIPKEQVEQLLKKKQKEMAFQMDQYYRQRMAEMVSTQKEEAQQVIERLARERDEARNNLLNLQKQTKQDTAIFHEQAEKGYQDLYTSIQQKHNTAISTLTQELSKSREEVDTLRKQ